MTARLELMEQVVDCEACALHEGCTAPVFGTIPHTAADEFNKVSGHKPRIAILGDFPGAEEDQAGSPFTGPAGQAFRKRLTAAGIDCDTVAFIYAVACQPTIDLDWDHINACAKNRNDQLALSGATHVLCVGKVATQGTEPTLDMTHGRARPWLQDGRVFMATYGIATRHQEALADDVRVFAEIAKGGDWLDYVKPTCAACSEDMYWMQENGLTWCLEHVPGDDQAKAQAWRARQIQEMEEARTRVAAPKPTPVEDDSIVDRNVVHVGADHPETSKAAAEKALPKSGTHRREIYEIIKAAGPNGMTDKELEAQTERAHEGVSADRRGLVIDQQVFDSGLKRDTPSGNPAIVWVVKEFA